MVYEAKCNHIFCPHIHPQPLGVAKGQKKNSESSNVAYQIKGNGAWPLGWNQKA